MKFFLATIQCAARTPDSLLYGLGGRTNDPVLPEFTTITHRFLLARLGTRFTWSQFNQKVGYPFALPASGDATDLVDDRGHRAMDMVTADPMHVVQSLADRFANASNLWVTEVTPIQHKWLWRGEGRRLGGQMFYPFYASRSGQRHNAISRFIRDRFDMSDAEWKFGYGNTTRGNVRIVYHGASVYASNFKQRRNQLKELCDMVRAAIKDSDVSELQEHIIEYCDLSMLDWGETLPRIALALDKHGLELGLTKCHCDHIEREDDTREVGRRGGTTWCHSCFEDDAVYVQDRDEYWPRDDAYEHDSGDYYSYEQEEDEDDSESDEDSTSLMSYMTKVLDYVSPDPDIVSSPSGNFLMGVEFEMITEGRVYDAVSDVRAQLGEEYCVCKSDGSLDSGGLEIVTAPRGMAEHIERFKKWSVDSQYRAWDRKCCGMHIHIDSRAFTEMTLGKFIMFINANDNTDFIRKIAGRHANRDSQAQSYCQVEGQESLVNPKRAVMGKNSSRYYMVNTTCLRRTEAERLGVRYVGERDFNTIELRIFRASLKKERLLAQIEFAHAAVMFCRVASWRELNQATFLKFLKSSSSLYPNLADWYGVRRRVQPCLTGKQTTCQDQPETV